MRLLTVSSYLRNVLGVDAVYGVAHVLPGRHQEREGEARHHRDRLQQRDNVVIVDTNICRESSLVLCSAPSVPQPVFTITEKAPTRAIIIRDGRL